MKIKDTYYADLKIKTNKMVAKRASDLFKIVNDCHLYVEDDRINQHYYKNAEDQFEHKFDWIVDFFEMRTSLTDKNIAYTAQRCLYIFDRRPLDHPEKFYSFMIFILAERTILEEVKEQITKEEEASIQKLA